MSISVAIDGKVMKFKDSKEYNDYMSKHNMTSTGGSSGQSPLAAAYGEYDQKQKQYQQAQQAQINKVDGIYGHGFGWLPENSQQNRQQILDNYGAIYNAGMGYIDRQGEQEGSDIREGWRKQGAEAQQNMVSRGLAGTTIPNTVNQSVTRNTHQDLGRMNDRLNMQRAQVNQSIGGAGVAALANESGQHTQNMLGLGMDYARFHEGITHMPPDPSFLASMAQQYGQTGGQQQPFQSQPFRPQTSQQQPATQYGVLPSTTGLVEYKGGAGGGIPSRQPMGNHNIAPGSPLSGTAPDGSGYIKHNGIFYGDHPEARKRSVPMTGMYR